MKFELETLKKPVKKNIIKFREESTAFFDEAMDASAAENYFTALRACRNAIRTDQVCLDYYIFLSEIFYDMQLYENCINVNLKLLCIDETVVECYFIISRAFLAMGEEQTALKYFRQGIELGAYYDDDTAREDAEELLETFKNSPKFTLIDGEKENKTMLNLSEMLISKHDYGEALRTLSYVPEESKHYSDALILRSDCYLAQQDYAASRLALESVFLREPDNIDAMCNLYTGCMRQGHEAEAADILARIMTADIRDGEQLFRVACMLLQFRNHTAGLELLNRVRDKSFYDARVIFLQGLCMYNTGDTASAKRNMMELLDIDDANTVAMYYNQYMQDNPVCTIALDYFPSVPDKEAKRRLRLLNQAAFDAKKDPASADGFLSVKYNLALLRWGVELGEFSFVSHVLPAFATTAPVDMLIRELLVDIVVPVNIKRVLLKVLMDSYASSPICVLIGADFNILDCRTPQRLSKAPAALERAWINVFCMCAVISSGFEEPLRKLTATLAKHYLDSGEALSGTESPDQFVKNLSAAIFYIIDKTCGKILFENMRDYANLFDAREEETVHYAAKFEAILNAASKKKRTKKPDKGSMQTTDKEQKQDEKL